MGIKLTTNSADNVRFSDQGSAKSGAPAFLDADLATIIDSWERLPEALKVGILAMVRYSRNDPLRVDFDREIKRKFHGQTVTSDAELLGYRELDDALGLTSTAAIGLHDSRTGPNTPWGIT